MLMSRVRMGDSPPFDRVDAVSNWDAINRDAIRPRLLSDFTGQLESRESLRVFIAAAKDRGRLWTMSSFTARRVWAKRTDHC
jgi:hypothetical protein